MELQEQTRESYESDYESSSNAKKGKKIGGGQSYSEDRLKKQARKNTNPKDNFNATFQSQKLQKLKIQATEDVQDPTLRLKKLKKDPLIKVLDQSNNLSLEQDYQDHTFMTSYDNPQNQKNQSTERLLNSQLELREDFQEVQQRLKQLREEKQNRSRQNQSEMLIRNQIDDSKLYNKTIDHNTLQGKDLNKDGASSLSPVKNSHFNSQMALYEKNHNFSTTRLSQTNIDLLPSTLSQYQNVNRKYEQLSQQMSQISEELNLKEHQQVYEHLKNQHQYNKLNLDLKFENDYKLHKLYKNPILEQIKQRDVVEKEKQQQAQVDKKQLVQRKQKYSEFVREVFKPSNANQNKNNYGHMNEEEQKFQNQSVYQGNFNSVGRLQTNNTKTLSRNNQIDIKTLTQRRKLQKVQLYKQPQQNRNTQKQVQLPKIKVQGFNEIQELMKLADPEFVPEESDDQIMMTDNDVNSTADNGFQKNYNNLRSKKPILKHTSNHNHNYNNDLDNNHTYTSHKEHKKQPLSHYQVEQ
eukprot:403346617